MEEGRTQKGPPSGEGTIGVCDTVWHYVLSDRRIAHLGRIPPGVFVSSTEHSTLTAELARKGPVADVFACDDVVRQTRLQPVHVGCEPCPRLVLVSCQMRVDK